MKLEAINKPLKVLLPDPDREVLLHPGQPMDFPPGLAWKLLDRAKGKVRLWINPEADWLSQWRLVAEISAGLEATDPRLPHVMRAIASCDTAFSAGSKANFLSAVQNLIQAMQISPRSSSEGTSRT